MKKGMLLILLSISLLSSGCGTNEKKEFRLCVSPQQHVRYAYYEKCVTEGSLIKVTKEDPKLGELIEHIKLSDGSEYYFYLAEGYELIH